MTATNHALTGAIIGLSIHQPILAIPLAFVSHYVLDSIPHSGGIIEVSDKRYGRYLIVEALLCFLLVLVLATAQPTNWSLAAICAFVATSPDFMWVPQYLAESKGKKPPRIKHWWVKLHHDVQWFQKPSGIIVEAAWAIACLTVLAILIKT